MSHDNPEIFNLLDELKEETIPKDERTWEERFVEEGAAIEHTRWANWQAHFFSKCGIRSQEDDSTVHLSLPKELYERWLRQIATPYAELSEHEKESDRREVRSYLPLLHTHQSALAEEVEALRKNEVKWKKAKYDVKSVDAVLYNRGIDDALAIIRRHLTPDNHAS